MMTTTILLATGIFLAVILLLYSKNFRQKLG